MAMRDGVSSMKSERRGTTIRVRESSVLVSTRITVSYCDYLTLRTAAMCLSQATLYTEVRHKVVFA